MLKKLDWVIFSLIVILSLTGLFTLLSTNIDIEGNIELGGVFSRQLSFMLLGLVGFFVIGQINHVSLKYYQVLVPFYLAVLGLLIYVLLAGPVINNVQRWMIVGGVQVQPSEFAKLILILTTAAIFSVRNRFDDLILAILSLLPLIPYLIVIFLEPHGSMTMITLSIWVVIVFTYMREQRRNILLLALLCLSALSVLFLFNGNYDLGIVSLIGLLATGILAAYRSEDLKKLILMASLIGVVFGGVLHFSWNDILKDYQRERIETFFDPEGVDTDRSFNVEQSKVAIGSGGLWGKGFGSGTQSRLQYLPEHQTDFIFATFAEQFGLFGSIILITLYSILILRCLLFAYKFAEHDIFSSMVIFGITVKLLIEVFINIGTNTGLIPATGIPLPFMSAGGTNIVVTFFSFGIIQSIISSNQDKFHHEPLIDNDDLLI